MSEAKSQTFWLDPGSRPVLEQAGLATFEGVMACRWGHCLRVLRDRENWHLCCDAAAEGPLGMYLKKHHVSTWATRLGACLRVAPAASAGRVEAENVRRLAALGIDVPRLVAFGERLAPDGRLDSFLLTEELSGYCELQDFVQRRFLPTAQRAGRADPALRRLIVQVAGMARRFHAAGYNHRDLYSCHFLVKEPRPGQFDVRLIDLQRMQRRRWLRHRWIVKDLAQLASMLPGQWVRCRDRVLFLHEYLGVTRLRRADRRLVRDVLRKQQIIQRRQRRGA